MTREERTRFAADEACTGCEWLADAVTAERREQHERARSLRIAATGRLKEALRALQRMEEE